MAKLTFWYVGREEFMDALIRDGYGEGTALAYASQLVKDTKSGVSARMKWEELMDSPLPTKYFLRNYYNPSAPEEEAVPFYMTSQEFYGQEIEESSEEESTEEVDNTFVQQIIEDVIDVERKSQVSLLLNLMQDIMGLPMDTNSKLEVIALFITRMEEIEWARQ